MSDAYRVRLATMGIVLDAVEVTVDGDFLTRGRGSTAIEVEVMVTASAPEDQVRALIAEVERVAEIPRTIGQGPPISVGSTVIAG
ncbi:MAG: OsmC family protein [Candidatus Limnocylindrales bacterium]